MLVGFLLKLVSSGNSSSEFAVRLGQLLFQRSDSGLMLLSLSPQREDLSRLLNKVVLHLPNGERGDLHFSIRVSSRSIKVSVSGVSKVFSKRFFSRSQVIRMNPVCLP